MKPPYFSNSDSCLNCKEISFHCDGCYCSKHDFQISEPGKTTCYDFKFFNFSAEGL